MIFASMKHLRSIVVFVVRVSMSSGLTTNVVGHCLLRGGCEPNLMDTVN